MSSDYMICIVHNCKWKTIRWKRLKDGFMIIQYNPLLVHYKRRHPEIYKDIEIFLNTYWIEV